jgi:hypothetical protein
MIAKVKEFGGDIEVERLFVSHSPYLVKPGYVSRFVKRAAGETVPEASWARDCKGKVNLKKTTEAEYNSPAMSPNITINWNLRVQHLLHLPQSFWYESLHNLGESERSESG